MISWKKKITKQKSMLNCSNLGAPKAEVSDFEASSIRGITIFSIESVRRENVGSTMKSMKPEKQEVINSDSTFPMLNIQ